MRLFAQRSSFVFLAFVPVILAAAACGSTGSEAAPATNNPTVEIPTETGDADAATVAPTKPEEAIVPISTPDIRPSTLLGDLADAGIDTANLPAIDTMERPQRGAVMGSFKKSLGVECTGCHATTKLEDGGVALSAKAPTPKKRVAAKMYTEFVQKLRMADGSALYCDSCHQGKDEFLDRSNEKGVAKWMHENFATKLVQKDGTALTCASCHGKPFVKDFLDGWANPTPE